VVDTAPTDATLTRRPLAETLQTGRAVAASTVAPDPALEQQQLPRLLHDAPAAILLLELRSGCVVQANPAGRALTGPVAFPVPARAWADAVELRRPDGRAFAVGTSPPERIAQGLPVQGEPVSVPGDGRPRALWVTGFRCPLRPGRRSGQALLAFLEVDTGDDDIGQVRDRAVVAAGMAFTISDPRRPDDPLVFVNPSFERTTGYSREESLGRNCRFLQGPDTDPADVQRIRDALEQERSITTTLLNYRKDGTAFWNELSLSPVYDAQGGLTHFVGIQADVTVRVHAEQERERHLAAERAARAEAERAQRRLALLAEATSMLAATLDVDESLKRLTDLVVPMMADWCTVDLLGQDDEARRVAASHADATKTSLLARLQELQPTGLRDTSATASVLRGGPPVLLAEVPSRYLADIVEDDELRGIYEQLGHRSAIIVPLRARRQVLGALLMVTDGSGRVYDDEDLAMAADLARRAALTVDNARLYQREHDVAEALQRSLLPQLPDIAGLDTAAAYLPGSAARRSAATGTTCSACRTARSASPSATSWATTSPRPPPWAAAVGAAELRVAGQRTRRRARPARPARAGAGHGASWPPASTAGSSCPRAAATGGCRLANAGHLPPVLRGPDGGVRLLVGGVSLLVGAALGTTREELEEVVEPGSVLVLYTDGLVEHRGRDLDVGLDALVAAVAAAPVGSADAICNSLLDALTDGDLDDDVAILVVRVL
jgi:PAS domain S-box-containing protein